MAKVSSKVITILVVVCVAAVYFWFFDFTTTFRVAGHEYGGCDWGYSGCATFTVSANGSYKYRQKSDGETHTGVLPQTLIDTLKLKLREASLQQYSRRVSDKDCDSYTDGIDNRYTVSLNGRKYRLDTCETVLPYESEASAALFDVWVYLNSTVPPQTNDTVRQD